MGLSSCFNLICRNFLWRDSFCSVILAAASERIRAGRGFISAASSRSHSFWNLVRSHLPGRTGSSAARPETQIKAEFCAFSLWPSDRTCKSAASSWKNMIVCFSCRELCEETDTSLSSVCSVMFSLASLKDGKQAGSGDAAPTADSVYVWVRVVILEYLSLTCRLICSWFWSLVLNLCLCLWIQRKILGTYVTLILASLCWTIYSGELLIGPPLYVAFGRSRLQNTQIWMCNRTRKQCVAVERVQQQIDLMFPRVLSFFPALWPKKQVYSGMFLWRARGRHYMTCKQGGFGDVVFPLVVEAQFPPCSLVFVLS